MADTAIQITGLGKRYRYGGAAGAGGNLREDITDWAKGLFRRTDKGHSKLHDVRERHVAADPAYFWALKDINLEIKQGEMVGIIGPNGAGKSTLLKILSRITPPTAGRMEFCGRLSSLLEVGTGFHRELTGRENIFLNGSILGMKRAEIARKFDEIVAFAEVEKFIDTPVKFYSSGMYVRLAFAVAGHLEPEILVVDEVLAVGDASFQKKCLGKMGDVARQGRTVLFVSHNMTAVKSLCGRGVLLREGKVIEDGPIASVINAYVESDATELTSQEWPDATSGPGTESFRFRSIKLLPAGGAREAQLTVHSAFDFQIALRATRSGRINLSLHLYLLSGEQVFAVASQAVEVSPGVARFTCHVPADLLNDAVYSLSVMIVEDGESHFVLADALRFEVHDVAREGAWLGKWPGFVRPRMQWDFESA